VSKSFDPVETPSNSASHPDPSYLHMASRSRSAGKGLMGFVQYRVVKRSICDYSLALSIGIRDTLDAMDRFGV